MTQVALRVLGRLPATLIEARVDRLLVRFDGSADLDRQRAVAGANAVHLVFLIGSRVGPPDGAVLVHVDDTLVGSVAFFAHNGHIGQGEIPFRLPLPWPYGLAPLTVAFSPVGYPGRRRTPQTLEVVATLELVLSTVEA